ncbi:MAG TPA: glycosyl hydrolase family 18 protein [Bacteroidia bacterium]|jgi:spore germination protein YaaH|nr:glycosyl hydrolase family 18 protein [Bacteroidia bacterium]
MIRKVILGTGLFLLGSCLGLLAQGRHKSFMQEQSEYYSQFHFARSEQWDSLLGRCPSVSSISPSNKSMSSTCTLNKRVFGWYPYWQSSTYSRFQWNLLSDLCYFDYTVTPGTGANSNTSYAWRTDAGVTAALSNGVKAEITITLFSSFTTFFGSSTAMTTCINNCISDLNARPGAKGINVDFEGMAASDKANFSAFIHQLNTALKTANPSYEVSICLYAVDWGPVFDIPTLNNDVGLYIIMGYDYYYGGSATAGPSGPLYDFQTGYNYNQSKSITEYQDAGVPLSKLCLGVPYYGQSWPTAGNTAPSSTSGTGAAVIYNTFRTNASGYYNTFAWESNSYSPYYPYQISGAWHQCWIDNTYSYGRRYDVVNQRGIAGIGIWAMGYDDGYTELWTTIQNKFSTCAVVPCTDTIYDMGGPHMAYYDGEDYTYTIAPTGATSVSLTFSSFSVQAGKDTLWLYNGPSTASPLIGKYTGTNSPGAVGGSSPSITMRFKSAGTTPGQGFQAIWTCNGAVIPGPDTTKPTTAVIPPAGWITSNFNCGFTDADNSGGSGLEKCFYQVSDYNNTEWRSNNTRGYFNDDFIGSVINPEWINSAGTWTVSGGILDQTDQTNTNTNLSAPLTQTLSNKYLYNWQGKISGTGTNRRAGLHIFCDSATTTNRSNNYFVWFRVDQNVCEFYKCTHNVFSLVNSVAMTTTAGTWYDWKVVYDRTTGLLQVYQNDKFIGSYTDPSPISTGNYVSFRSGNCDWAVQQFKVYRSRISNTAVPITIGSAASDIRYQNPSPSIPSGRVCTIDRDSANNMSVANCQTFNVDWTPPLSFTANDGMGADQDTTYSTTQLSANWTTSSDPNSGIANYSFAIGTSPGASDIVAWTNNGTATSITQNGLSLNIGQIYYFSIKSTNGAGLQSALVNTDDGTLIQLSTGINDPAMTFMLDAFPNPFKDQLHINYTLPDNSSISIRLVDIGGRTFPVYSNNQESAGKHQYVFNAEGYAKGMYMLEVTIGSSKHYLKLLLQ